MKAAAREEGAPAGTCKHVLRCRPSSVQQSRTSRRHNSDPCSRRALERGPRGVLDTRDERRRRVISKINEYELGDRRTVGPSRSVRKTYDVRKYRGAFVFLAFPSPAVRLATFYPRQSSCALPHPVAMPLRIQSGP